MQLLCAVKSHSNNMEYIDICIQLALNQDQNLDRTRKLNQLKPFLKTNEHPEKGLLRILAEEIINLRNPYNIQPIETNETSNTSDIIINVRKRGRPRKLDGNDHI